MAQQESFLIILAEHYWVTSNSLSLKSIAATKKKVIHDVLDIRYWSMRLAKVKLNPGHCCELLNLTNLPRIDNNECLLKLKKVIEVPRPRPISIEELAHSDFIERKKIRPPARLSKGNSKQNYYIRYTVDNKNNKMQQEINRSTKQRHALYSSD
ncbi:428_t:CDS:2 [Entrophospora sp. SA101]|nr:11768_t:CDS:2 [Entrophospora sp. SA101]CAJ0846519.1 428_t:CDS:2 [Entrophospora sp. SA101]